MNLNISKALKLKIQDQIQILEQHTETLFLISKLSEEEVSQVRPTVWSAQSLVCSRNKMSDLYKYTMKYLQIGFFLNVSCLWQTEGSVTKIFGSISFISHLTEMDSSSLIHLFIGGLQNSQLCCVAGAVFVFELPF